MVFHFLAIPWMQRELDDFVMRYNSFKPRFDRHRIGPNEAPDVLYSLPLTFDTMDFKVRISRLHHWTVPGF